MKSRNDSINRPIVVSIGSSIGIVAVLLMSFFLFFGNVEVQFRSENFIIDATWSSNIAIRYEDVDSIRYFEAPVPVGREFDAVSTFRIFAGVFENVDFGRYQRYTCKASDGCIGIAVNGEIFLISGGNTEETRMIYEELRKRIL